MLKRLLLSLILMAPAYVTAEDQAMLKFVINGDTLIYDTETNVSGDDAEIENDDVDQMRSLLRSNPGITTLELNSGGGSVYAGDEMARIIIDFGLDTVVSGECISSCVNVFLGGNARRMMRGSKIGFHQRYWSEKSIKKYYDRWHEDENWETPFEFTSWVYEDTQAETYEDLMYIVSRGVEPGFAIRTKRVNNDDEWFPSREELVKAGVLRD